MSWLTTLPFSGIEFVVGMSIDVRMPWVRTVFRSKARRKILSKGSSTTPFIVSVTSMASRYSSFVSSRSSKVLSVIWVFGRFGAGMRILPATSA